MNDQPTKTVEALMPLNTFAGICGHFFNMHHKPEYAGQQDVNNGYNCDHPDCKAGEDGIGACLASACPLCYPADGLVCAAFGHECESHGDEYCECDDDYVVAVIDEALYNDSRMYRRPITDTPYTQPLQAGSVTVGLAEANVAPFEDATADLARINEYLKKNPAYRTHIIPDALISSCSQCCMQTINGQPNILGMMFRKSRGKHGCSLCPVAMASEKLPARDASGEYITDKHGNRLSEAQVIRMAEDGEK